MLGGLLAGGVATITGLYIGDYYWTIIGSGFLIFIIGWYTGKVANESRKD